MYARCSLTLLAMIEVVWSLPNGDLPREINVPLDIYFWSVTESSDLFIIVSVRAACEWQKSLDSIDGIVSCIPVPPIS